MSAIHLISPSGETTTLQAHDGDSVMLTATHAGLDGIVGECGGSAMCATCHVYVDEEWAARLPAPSREEQDMVEGLDQRRASSRLGCQVMVTDALDGLVVTVAAAE